MAYLGVQFKKPVLIVDQQGRPVVDPAGNYIGQPGIFIQRVLYPVDQNLSKRYDPGWTAGDTATIGCSFEHILARGVGITGSKLAFWRNLATPVDASAEWTISSGPNIEGRMLYALVTGGTPQIDYQLRWTATDQLGGTWTRTGLLLCTQLS